MERFCDFITNPNWWSVIATFVAAIVAACITSKFSKRQNELQEQQLKIQERQNELQEQQIKLQELQNKQQEYDVYRRIYTQIFDLDLFNKALLLRIVAILTNNEDKNLRLKLIEDIWNEFEKHSDEFSEWTLDLDLKKCGEGKDAKYYYDASQASRKIIQIFKYFVENELLNFNHDLVDAVQLELTTPPEKFIDVILKLYKGRNPQLLRNELLAYASIVEKTNQSQLLKNIKDRITPIDVK